MLHPSPEARLTAFAKESPLPKRPEGMAEALLDLAALFFAKNDLPEGGELDLTLIYRDGAHREPGAFLSNPAVLPTTRAPGRHGWSSGSHCAGFPFSYPHFQEATLGPALLLCAASPRKARSAASARLYAQAVLLLLDRGDASRAAGLDKIAEIAAGCVPRAELSHWSFGYGFDAAAASRLRERGAVLPRSAACARLAMEESKPDVFDERTRATLTQWAARADATADAAALAAAAPDRPTSAARRSRI